jgi:phage terminase large subunit-like protein
MLQTIHIIASPADLGHSVAISPREELARVDRDIAEAEVQLARQAARIAQLAAGSQSTTLAEALLGTMKNSVAGLRLARGLILASIAVDDAS